LPSIAFVDEETFKELSKLTKNEEASESKFPEYDFFATALKIGLTTMDLKELTYIDVLKILISFLEDKKGKSNVKKATQSDIDRLLG
jgi:hypothetical protein